MKPLRGDLLLNLCVLLISIYHKRKDYIFLYIYGMREAIRNVSSVHLWKYFYGNGKWIEFELKLNMNLLRQRYHEGPKQTEVNSLNFFMASGNKRSCILKQTCC